ncbi:hypothetical protein Tco_0112099 [Tanacetum coccineum]
MVSLLVKQVWRLITSPTTLAARILKACYFLRSSFFDAKIGYRPSYIWRSFLSVKDIVRKGYYYSEDQYAIFKIWNQYNILEDIKRGPYSKKSPIRRIQYLDMPRHFKTLSLDKLRSPDFNLLSDQEYSEEEEAEAMVETMEQYMSKTRTDYGSGVARPKINNKDQFEVKGQFLKELRENTFSDSYNEDANERIEKVLEIVDLFHVPNITVDQLMLRVFLISLTGAASHWLRNEPTGLIET